MKTQNIAVVSIHPDPDQRLGMDLKDILQSLRMYWQQWIWCVRNLDWLGNDSESVCRNVEAAGLRGLWMSSEELFRHASKVYQTIEGDFLAFPSEVGRASVTDEELNLRAFAASRAELAIVAVDGDFFEVLAKSPAFLDCLRHFHDVRDENASAYL